MYVVFVTLSVTQKKTFYAYDKHKTFLSRLSSYPIFRYSRVRENENYAMDLNKSS